MKTTNTITEIEFWTKVRDAYQESLTTGKYYNTLEREIPTINGICFIAVELYNNDIISSEIFKQICCAIDQELFRTFKNGYLAKYECEEGCKVRIDFCNRMIEQLKSETTI